MMFPRDSDQVRLTDNDNLSGLSTIVMRVLETLDLRNMSQLYPSKLDMTAILPLSFRSLISYPRVAMRTTLALVFGPINDIGGHLVAAREDPPSDRNTMLADV